MRYSHLWICDRILQQCIAAGALPARQQLFLIAQLEVDQVDESPIGTVLEDLREAGCRVEDIATREPSLEDVFVELTEGNARAA